MEKIYLMQVRGLIEEHGSIGLLETHLKEMLENDNTITEEDVELNNVYLS